MLQAREVEGRTLAERGSRPLPHESSFTKRWGAPRQCTDTG
jgi:hypothetical protein